MTWEFFNNIHWVIYFASLISLIGILIDISTKLANVSKYMLYFIKLCYYWSIGLIGMQVLFNGCLFVYLENFLFHLNQQNSFFGLPDNFTIIGRGFGCILVYLLYQSLPDQNNLQQ
jgi:hypothetical protein